MSKILLLVLIGVCFSSVALAEESRVVREPLVDEESIVDPDDISGVLGEPVLSEGEPPSPVSDEPTVEWLETTREYVYEGFYWLVEGVDGWFGDKPFDESGGRVSGSVLIRTLYREDDGFDGGVKFRLDVDMPNVSERAYVFIGRENESELVTGQQETFTRSQQLLPESRSEDTTLFVGIGYMLRDNFSLSAGVRGGYKVYTQARYREDWWLAERSNLAFRQTFFLAVDDGLGSTTGLNFTQVLNERRVFRWLNSVTYGTETDGVEWSTAAGIAQSLSGQREISLDLLANGETDSAVDVNEYGVRSIYRRPLYRDWLIGDFILGYFWPRDEDDPERQESWAAGLNLTLRF
jgi:hypothetical protein